MRSYSEGDIVWVEYDPSAIYNNREDTLLYADDAYVGPAKIAQRVGERYGIKLPIEIDGVQPGKLIFMNGKFIKHIIEKGEKRMTKNQKIKKMVDSIVDNWDEVIAEYESIERGKILWLYNSKIPKIIKMKNIDKHIPGDLAFHIENFIVNHTNKVKKGHATGKPTKTKFTKMLKENFIEV